MADREVRGESEAPFAKRIDPAKESLTPEQIQFIRRVEVEQWRKRSQKLRGRNVLTALAIGAVVAGIYGYTFYSVSQEKIMEEIEQEASLARTRREEEAAAAD